LETISDEKFIRINIWWSFNDYIRNGHEKDISSDMQKLNAENLIALLKILDESDNNELLMKAEALRNLGQFEESKQLLDRISDNDIGWVKEKLLAEINKQNTQVFQLY
jgi:hypothetical protein